VLDVGGAAGAYALPLAAEGYEAAAQREAHSPQPSSVTTAYFHGPDELEREVAAAGFEVRALVAVEGAVGAAAETHALDAWIDDTARRELLLRVIRRVEAEPSLLGASPHVMAFATAP
jgi:hypothetical protein